MTNHILRYPTLESFAEFSMRKHPSINADAPWFEVDGIRNPKVCFAYLNADREVPGEITFRSHCLLYYSRRGEAQSSFVNLFISEYCEDFSKHRMFVGY